MTEFQRIDLDVLNKRLDQTAAMAMIVATHSSLAGELSDALRGIAETLGEIATRMDMIVNPRA
jgi:hypothetical protein